MKELNDSLDNLFNGDTGPVRTAPVRENAVEFKSAEQRFEAASREKLYLKLERGRFYALFGDYETGLGVTELSRYSRTLTGVKIEREGDVLGFQLFATDIDSQAILTARTGLFPAGIAAEICRELGGAIDAMADLEREVEVLHRQVEAHTKRVREGKAD